MNWEYVITDMGSAHFWTGGGFIPIELWNLGRDEILSFPTEAKARKEVLRQRKRGTYLKVVRQIIKEANGTSHLLAQEDVSGDAIYRLN
jgi:hypothetical protein